MEHALVKIEQNAPASLEKQTPPTHATHSAAHTLVEMFTDEASDATKVNQLRNMATAMTCDEFAKAIKAAKDMADAIDSANGFKKPEGAKGQAAYGPKRQLMNARSSEAKRIFGVAKQAPDVLKEKGYWPAVNAARSWLDSNGKTWDGNTAETGEAKAARKAAEVVSAARNKVMLDNPQKMGETRLDYLTRIDGLMGEAEEAATAATFDKRVETIEASLRKQFGSEMDALMEACSRILATGNGEEAPL